MAAVGITAITPSAAEPSGELYKVMYSWLIPAVLGVPGNILAVLIATREHNMKLSPCIYMAAMGLADTALLLELVWINILVFLVDSGVITSAEYPLR
jgi:hypothetical protein